MLTNFYKHQLTPIVLFLAYGGLWACGALHYLHLVARIIWATADVLIISGILPNGAIASHLSANSSDSVTPPCITENPTTGFTISGCAPG